ncbi:MAG: PAS domain S-box protein, partial [Terriglobia bacterium]
LLVLMAWHRTPVPTKMWMLGIGLLFSDLLVLLLPLAWLEDPKLPYAVFIIDSGILTIVLYGISGYESETLLLYYLTMFMATLGRDLGMSVGIAVVASVLEVGLQLGRGRSVLHDPETLTHIPLFFVTAVLCSYLAENARTHEQRARELKEAQAGLVRDIARYAGDLTTSEQLRAEAQLLAQHLRENEERLRLFVEHAPAPIAMLDRNMKYLAASRRWLADCRLGDKDIVGRSYYDLFPNLPDRWKEVHKRCLAGGVEKSEEDSIIHPDGTTDWVRWEIRPWHEPNGQVGGLLLFSEIITERKRAEQALRDSEERYRRFLELNAAGVLRSTLDGKILDCNRSLVRMLGYDSIEGLKSHNTDDLYFFPGFRDLILKRAKTESVLVGNEMCLKRMDGSPVWVLFNVSLIDGDGETGGVLEGTLIDITVRKRAEEALKNNEATLARAQRIAHLGNWVQDLIKDELHWSDECYRIFGVTAEAFRPSFEEFLRRVHPEDRGMVKKAYTDALYQDKPYSLDHRIVLPDGSSRYVHEEAEITRDEAGKAISMLGTVHDVTEQKQLEQQFRQAQKMEAVGRLAGGVAHDFNNLLTIINGYSEFTLDGLKLDDPNRKHVEEVRKAGERAASLTRQLLAFSRQQVMDLQVLDLNSVITSMNMMLGRLIGEDINLVTVTGKDLGRVKADPGQIEQIIVNLAVNARDAMPQGGKIIMETRNVDLDAPYAQTHGVVKAGPYVMLAMSDTGIGMDAETQKRIFEPFFTTKEIGKGTGLGLSTVYGIVKQSDGYTWVYSEPGKGTTFKIYLPRIDEPLEVHGLENADAEAARGTETLLVVEDEPAVRMLVLESLRMKGYRVLEASNGAEAISIAAQNPRSIHLLIADVVMPEIGGRVLAEGLMSTHPEMKVLYMSGYTDNAIVHHGVLETGTAFLQKPFTPKALAQKVREVLNCRKHIFSGVGEDEK